MPHYSANNPRIKLATISGLYYQAAFVALAFESQMRVLNVRSCGRLMFLAINK